jgi:hypothetical protein
MKRSKYKNVPTVVDGIRFASKAEAKRDGELQKLERGGHVKDIKRQPRYPLVVNGVNVCTYVGDWEYFSWEGGQFHRVVEDRKGVLTAAFKIKWKLARALYPDIEFRLS